eukprot:TRINITY_DN13135_c0_g1_i1.p1 TRINITY_DN13135_c0_g1~~TRINITY_DN13135_c0_g1_i1.p1  ORF type:complete len:66 (+),score=2.64 TRINITY_DN13135_c0_g1_i1:155-352(+)
MGPMQSKQLNFVFFAPQIVLEAKAVILGYIFQNSSVKIILFLLLQLEYMLTSIILLLDAECQVCF